MPQPVNPYVAGAPLRGEKGFFGREQTLSWVLRELRNPATNALVLYGQRRIGKTTLLLQLQRTLPADLYQAVYFDLQDQAARPLGMVLADLADTIAERMEAEAPEPTLFDDRGRYFRAEFLPEILQLLGTRRLILLLDEFDVLEQAAEFDLPLTASDKALFPFLRRIMLEEPRLAFVFVVGRRAEDLTLDFTSTFKASLTREVWALDDESAIGLVRQAEKNGTLRFEDNAVIRILALSSRHPYLTQLLCQRIWERAYLDNPKSAPNISTAVVEEAVSDALETGYQAFAWLWDGLSPAEKIYASAFAESTEEGSVIPEDQVIQVLAAHAARLRTREVELAPRDLVRRRVLIEVNEHQYQFSIELFRRWVQRNKPLREVKNELDQIDPLADRTYEIGLGYFRRRQWEPAIRYFDDALAANPRHFRARLNLGEALLESGNIDQALSELEKAHELDREEARLPLARVLIAQTKVLIDAGNEDAALETLDKALELSPLEFEARELRSNIWNRRGERFLELGELEAALQAYGEAGNDEKVAEIQQIQLQNLINQLENRATAHLGAREWEEAAAIYQQLLSEAPIAPEVEAWRATLIHVEEEKELARLFNDGLGYLERKAWPEAQASFTEIIYRRPSYQSNGKSAIQLLEQSVSQKATRPYRRLSAIIIAIVVLLSLVVLTFLAANFFVHGPTDGRLVHTRSQGLVHERAGVHLRDFVADVRFQNPYSASIDDWSYGLGFRVTGIADQYRLVIRSDKRWYLQLWQPTESIKMVDSGMVDNLLTDVGRSNRIQLIAIGGVGYFSVNNVLIDRLPLNAKRDAGNLYVATGFYGDIRPGQATEYWDFSVRPIP